MPRATHQSEQVLALQAVLGGDAELVVRQADRDVEDHVEDTLHRGGMSERRITRVARMWAAVRAREHGRRAQALQRAHTLDPSMRLISTSESFGNVSDEGVFAHACGAPCVAHPAADRVFASRRTRENSGLTGKTMHDSYFSSHGASFSYSAFASICHVDARGEEPPRGRSQKDGATWHTDRHEPGPGSVWRAPAA